MPTPMTPMTGPHRGILASLLLPLLLLLVQGGQARVLPEQVHVAFGATPDRMAVQWATRCLEPRQTEDGPSFSLTPPPPPRSLVRYGLAPETLTQTAEGAAMLFTDSGPRKRKQWEHVVNITGLAASTRYYYQVGEEETTGPVFTFKTAPDAATLAGELPLRIAVYGDMGVDKNGSTVKHRLVSHVLRDPDWLDMVLHVGDMAYDMYERDGAQGDLFMNEIQPLAARVPYMVDVGNHEKAYQFSHYTERFRLMPVTDPEPVWTFNGPAPNNWWYSFNLGPVHFVAISTEIYDFAPWYVPRQFAWLEADLAAANANRTAAPWVIVHGHKPLYCSSPSPESCDSWYAFQREGFPFPTTSSTEGGRRGIEKRYGLEALFHRYGVDLYVCGHQHNYERQLDIAPGGVTTRSTVDPPATTYIVTGAGGNREDITPFTTEAPDRVATRALEWGYSVMEVHNGTHIRWEQRGCDHHKGKHDRDEVIDEFWLVQRRHGSFEGRGAAAAAAAAGLVGEEPLAAERALRLRGRQRRRKAKAAH